jgi:hypothetical protein
MTGLFTNGTTLSATALNDAINSLTLNAQSGAGYTLVLADAGKLVTVSNASAQNLTIPLNATVAYATGTVIEVLNIGAGTWTLTPTGGVTLTGSTSIGTSTRVRLTKTGTDTWYANILGGGGLTFITSSAFTASSAVNVNNCFTSTYDNYAILLDVTAASTTLSVTMRLRVSGADNSTASYNGVAGWSNSFTNAFGTFNTNPGVASTSWNIASSMVTGNRMTAGMELYGPQLAVRTHGRYNSLYTETQTSERQSGLIFTAATQFDGFSLIPSTGTITGSLAVYGLAKA